MKIEIEISDEQVAQIASRCLVDTYGRQQSFESQIRSAVQKEVEFQMTEGDYKGRVSEIVLAQMDSLAQQNIISLSRHLIREMVQQMSSSGELQRVMERAIKDPKETSNVSS